MKNFSKHANHYIPLLGILLAGVLGFWIFSYDRIFQIAVAVAVSASYVIWGIVHHKIHKDLYPEVIVEYLLIALLGFIIIYTLILRA